MNVTVHGDTRREPDERLTLIVGGIPGLVLADPLAFGTINVSAQTATAPKSVIHVVTVAWKAGTTPDQIKAALDGVQKLPGQFKGLTRVWTKPLKLQDADGATVKKNHVFVMEFADETAFKAYTDSPAPTQVVGK